MAGRHRVEAARKLGWTEIEAVVRECDETDARLWEIAENLHRAELTAQERAEHIAEWVRLRGEKVGQLIPPGGRQPNDQGIRKAARELPVAGDTDEAKRKNVERAVKIAAIAPEAKEAARAAGLDDNQSALLAVARAAPAEQIAKVAEIAERRAVEPAPAPLNDVETEEQWLSAIMRVWNRGAPQWRERFLETVDAAVFDRTRAGAA
ncbi:MAG: ParB N-terminal domain-containing protein [Rhodospirillales bacterium]|nr:ParB N-terminal domain-containing protein [Rhodospirillales bacterium]